MAMGRRARAAARWGGLVLSVLLFVCWVGSRRTYVVARSWGASFRENSVAIGGGALVLRKEGPLRDLPSANWQVMTGRLSRDERTRVPTFLPWFRRDPPGPVPPRVPRPTRYDLMVPLWIPLVPMVGLTLWLWLWRRRLRPGCCPRCGYDLTGNTTGVCPECGAARGAGAPI